MSRLSRRSALLLCLAAAACALEHRLCTIAPAATGLRRRRKGRAAVVEVSEKEEHRPKHGKLQHSGLRLAIWPRNNGAQGREELLQQCHVVHLSLHVPVQLKHGIAPVHAVPGSNAHVCLESHELVHLLHKPGNVFDKVNVGCARPTPQHILHLRVAAVTQAIQEPQDMHPHSCIHVLRLLVPAQPLRGLLPLPLSQHCVQVQQVLVHPCKPAQRHWPR